MLTKKDIEGMIDGQIFETVALVKSYDIRPTKNNSKYIDGVLEVKGSVPFKVWSGSLFDDMEKCEYRGVVCHINGKVNEYQGKKSVILSDVRALEKGLYDESDFFEEKYNPAAYIENLNTMVEKTCSPEAQSIYSEVIGSVLDRFKVEFAARGHHDAVRSGLLAHTCKVTFILNRVIKIYPALCDFIDMDVLYLGAIFHDIGKIYEYTNGSIVGNGLLVSHHTFGVEILSGYKDKIVSLKSEEFYYRLLAIIEQHHGEFEETPRTIEAYIIHSIDLIESRFQAMNETVESGLSTISIDGLKLN